MGLHSQHGAGKPTAPELHPPLSCFAVFGVCGVPWQEKVAIDSCSDLTLLHWFEFLVVQSRRFCVRQDQAVADDPRLSGRVTFFRDTIGAASSRCVTTEGVSLRPHQLQFYPLSSVRQFWKPSPRHTQSFIRRTNLCTAGGLTLIAVFHASLKVFQLLTRSPNLSKQIRA